MRSTLHGRDGKGADELKDAAKEEDPEARITPSGDVEIDEDVKLEQPVDFTTLAPKYYNDTVDITIDHT